MGRNVGEDGGIGYDPWMPEVTNSHAAVEWAKPFAQQFRRVVRPGGAIALMAGAHAVAAWMVACEDAGLIWMAEMTVLWNTGKPRANNFGSLTTHILWFVTPGARHTWNSDRRSIYSNVLVCKKVPIQHREHPAQKPLELTTFLISLLTRANDVVLDPFAGSGSTLVSAEIVGRRWLGFERNRENARAAQRRTANWEVEEEGCLMLWTNGKLEEV